MKIIFLALLLLSQIAVAQTEGTQLILGVGSELRPAKEVNGDFANQTLQNYAFGLGFDSSVFILETAKYTTWSGNNTLNVSTTYQDYLLWGQWRGDQWARFTPFLGAGIGAYTQSVTTTLAGISKNDNSPMRLLTGVSFGLSFHFSVFFSSIEGRAFFGDRLDSQPTLGGLVRAGLWF